MIFNNLLIIAGGFKGNTNRSSSFECYDPKIDVWNMMVIYLTESLEAACLSTSNDEVLKFTNLKLDTFFWRKRSEWRL